MLKSFHIVTATHDSRTSQRMIDFKVRLKRDNGLNSKAQFIWFTSDEEILITQSILDIIVKDKFNIHAFNICGDHFHMLLECEEEVLTGIVGKIKSISSRAYNIEKGYTLIEPLHNRNTRGHAPLH